LGWDSALVRNCGADRVASDRNGNGNEHLMFVTDAYFVECPEQIVPSSVWLEVAKERTDVLRNIFGPPVERIFKFRSTPRKGECAVFRGNLAAATAIPYPA
jgi:hypothetical protein